MKTHIAAWLYVLLCMSLWFYLADSSLPSNQPLEQEPFCKDPYAEFNQRAWDYCNQVDRYYEI